MLGVNMSVRSACLAAVVSLCSVAVARATVISTYTDQAAWQAALSGTIITTEQFNGVASSFAANSSGNAAGSVSVDLVGGVGDPGPTGLTGSGFLQGEVDSSPIGSDDGLSLNIDHTPAVGIGLLGLQNDSASNPAGLNLVEIGLLIDGSGFLVSDLLGLTDSAATKGALDNAKSDGAIPFLGFILDHAVSSFSIVHGDQLYGPGVAGTSEEFYLDGLMFASQPALRLLKQSELPLPSTVALLLIGMVSLRQVRRGC
jgi:hypothetical protein